MRVIAIALLPLTISGDGEFILDVGRVITGSDQDPVRGVAPPDGRRLRQ
jgi:hypothetical protein